MAEMKTGSLLCRLGAIFLRYPDEEIKREAPALKAAILASGLSESQKRALVPLAEDLAETPLLDAQERYVGLFDLSPSLSLYLFQHVHGDSRARGPAMASLKEDYQKAGLAIDGNELPDFLPVFLEYCSTGSEPQIADLLAETADVLGVLEKRLGLRKSLYQGIFSALLEAGGKLPNPKTLAAHLAETLPMDDLAALDAQYEEKPVSFLQPAAGSEDCKTPPCQRTSPAPIRDPEGIPQ